jgi:hypothetical protein
VHIRTNFYHLVAACICLTSLSIRSESDSEYSFLDDDLLSFVDLAGEEIYPLEITTIHQIIIDQDEPWKESVAVYFDEQTVPQAPDDIVIVTYEESVVVPSDSIDNEIVPVPHTLINSVKQEKEASLQSDKQRRKKERQEQRREKSKRSNRKNRRQDQELAY